MRQKVIIALIIVAVLGGLMLAAKTRAPKTPPPTTQEIWKDQGVPVETATITMGDMEQTVEVTGDISALNSVTLSSKIPGRIASVFAREGDQVAQGQTIVVLDQEDALSNLQNAQGGLESAIARLSQAKTNAKVTKIQTDSAIEQAQSSVDAAASRLAVVKTPSRTQDRSVAENRVASAQANLDNAQANFKRNQTLLKQGAISASSYDIAKAQYLVAQADAKSAQDQLSIVKEGGRSEDISAAKSQVDVAKEQLRAAKANASQNLLRLEDIRSALAGVQQAQAAVAMAKQQLSNTYIKAPISGQISSRTAEAGQVVSAGQALAQVVNMGSVYLKADVSEKQLDSIAKGQPVRVRIDAIPGKQFQAVVTEIYPSGSISSRNFSVRITLQGANFGIKPGMFARGEIVTGISKNVVLVPKDAVDVRKGTRAVFILQSDKTVKRNVVTVLRENREYAQLAMPNALKTGDIVATQGRQNLQEGSKVLVSNGK